MKRQLESNECKSEKRSKNENDADDFLRLNDSHFTETNYQDAFHTIANKLINEYELVFNDQTTFRLVELEFYFYHELRHPDSFAHRHPEQQHYENWYFHRQGTSATASYKAGTYKYVSSLFS